MNPPDSVQKTSLVSVAGNPEDDRVANDTVVKLEQSLPTESAIGPLLFNEMQMTSDHVMVIVKSLSPKSRRRICDRILDECWAAEPPELSQGDSETDSTDESVSPPRKVTANAPRVTNDSKKLIAFNYLCRVKTEILERDALSTEYFRCNFSTLKDVFRKLKVPVGIEPWSMLDQLEVEPILNGDSRTRWKALPSSTRSLLGNLIVEHSTTKESKNFKANIRRVWKKPPKLESEVRAKHLNIGALFTSPIIHFSVGSSRLLMKAAPKPFPTSKGSGRPRKEDHGHSYIMIRAVTKKKGLTTLEGKLMLNVNFFKFYTKEVRGLEDEKGKSSVVTRSVSKESRRA